MPPIAASNFQKTKKVWPPNFKELSHQEQLRFEKKYKRRILMASRSPRWEKGIKYAQLLTITGRVVWITGFPEMRLTFCLAALVWLLFYSEFEWWGQQYKPSEEVRERLLKISLPTCADSQQIRRRASQIFGVLDKDKRYERRKDMVEPSATSKDSESESK